MNDKEWDILASGDVSERNPVSRNYFQRYFKSSFLYTKYTTCNMNLNVAKRRLFDIRTRFRFATKTRKIRFKACGL